MKGKILLAYMMIFILVFASCKANKSSYEIAIDNYVSHYNYESSDETNNSSIQDENKSKTVLGNYIKDPGLCIEDTTEPTSWLLPDTGGIYNEPRKQDRQNRENKLEWDHGKETKFYT